jgi:sigma-B regulation protein RsbU (phosphoserine phosphatase)
MPSVLELSPGTRKPWWRRRPPTGIAGAVFWLALWFGLLWLVRGVPGGGSVFFAWMQVLVGLSLIALAVPLTWQLARRHLLWSLRSKLVLTYLLIGLAPVVLVVTLVAISAYVAAGQFSVHLADTRLRQEISEMAAENGARTARLAHMLSDRGPGGVGQRGPGGPPRRNGPATGAQNQAPTEQTAAPDPGAAPTAGVALASGPAPPDQRLLRRQTAVFVDGAPMRQLDPPPDSNSDAHTALGLPPWASDLPRKEFRGLVLDGDELYLVVINQRRLEGSESGQLLSAVTSVPVDGTVMDMLAQGLGRVRLAGVMTGSTRSANVRNRTPAGEIDPMAASRAAAQQQANSTTAQKNARPGALGEDLQRTSVYGGTEPEPANFADIRVPFVSTMAITDWDTGDPDNAPIEVDSRPSLLYRQLFGSSISGIVTSYLRMGFIILSIIFGVIELLALIMALRVSHAITSSVAELYAATQRVDHGDFEHRIAVPREKEPDQLGELSRSFNSMTGSLQRLLIEQKEKERLQNELSIAQEVQANLFPSHARDLPTLELHGICRPARSVSGDYYDFLVFYHEHDGRHDNGKAYAAGVEAGVGIALGDISGKGISAALLMATLHSAVRAYRFASEELVFSANSLAGLTASKDGLPGDGGKLFESPGRILSLLNRHLYRSTQPEKYATLFLAHYDACTAYLTYSNAGQLPPLVLGRDGSVRRLDEGGTVVGLMDGMQYEEGRFQMRSGDILVAYSDGVTEPENDFGDFGEARLMEVVRRYRDHPLHVISGQVMAALDAWIGAEEQPDDITLVLARQV